MILKNGLGFAEFILIFFGSWIFIGCHSKAKFSNKTMEIEEKYNVKQITSSNGEQDYWIPRKNWKSIKPLSKFLSPWSDRPVQKTIFKATYDGNYFYFLFYVEDDFIHLEKKEKSDKLNAAKSDRVELFFKSDDEMNPYYSFEMDPMSRLYASKGRYYRKFDASWQVDPTHFIFRSSILKTGYRVEGKISMDFLKGMNLLQNGQLQTGIFRADYYQNDKKNVAVDWLSWIKPTSKIPDFHIPSAFGVLQLE